jgi:hypothetical protein
MTNQITTTSDTVSDLLAPSAFAHTYRIAKMFSSSQLVPAHFRGKPEECMVALALAQQLKVNPLLAMQNIFVVKGTPGFKTSFVIALANERGPFADPIQFEEIGKGKDLAVRAYAKMRSTGTTVDFTVSLAMAAADGWTSNPKYTSMPALMLRYRAAAILVRLYCPEVLMGYQTSEEVEDVSRLHVIDAEPTGVVAQINASITKEIEAESSSTHDPETGEVIEDEHEQAERYFAEQEAKKAGGK